MKFKNLALTIALATLASAASYGRAQSAPTATQLIQLSGFAGATGTYTGLPGGKNLGITAGIDVGIGSFHRFHPSIEVRGTYPFHDGIVDAQKNVLGGLKIDRTLFRRFHPYGDILFGRGEIDYEGAGYPSLDGRYFYVQTPTNVISYGAGVDFDLGQHFALKADGQFQHYNTPVTASGSLYSKPLTLGIVYRLDFNNRRHKK